MAPRAPTPRHLLSRLLLGALLLSTGPAFGQADIVLARLVNVPDQYVGGEILRAVYARLNVPVSFADVEGKRALVLSSSGQLDGEIQRIGNLSEAYPTLVRISPPINFIEPSVFTTTLSFDVRGWPSIRDYDIGIVRGVGSSEAGTRGMPRVQAVNSLEDLVRMLDRGRFDLLVTDRFSGQVAIRSQGMEKRIRALSPPLETIHIYHYLHERHRDLRLRVQVVLEEMRASGALARLRQELVDRILAEGLPTRP